MKDSLLYLDEKHYNKIVVTALSNDSVLEVISSPEDTRETVKARYHHFEPKSSTPNLDDWFVKSSKLISLVSGWIVKDSMIHFKGNFEKFLPLYYRDVNSWLGLPLTPSGLRDIWRLSYKMDRCFKARGINDLISRFKIISIVILQYLSGNPLRSTQDLGMRIKLIHGLPACLPFYFRNFIRSRDLSRIRVILTLFQSYKGMAGINSDPVFSSITSPRYVRPTHKVGGLSMPVGSFLPWTNSFAEDWSEVERSVRLFWRRFNPLGFEPTLLTSREDVPLTMTAGPNHKISFLGSMWDAILIIRGEKSHFRNYFLASCDFIYKKTGVDMTKDPLSVFGYLEKVGKDSIRSIERGEVKWIEFLNSSAFSTLKMFQPDLARILKSKRDDSITLSDLDTYILPYLRLGKLSLKFEAAGKIRVFAICDYWTQWMLKPLHQSIFKVLKAHPCDATFDQIGKVENFSKERYRYIASYDLKSATDMIPIQLYEKVLSFWTTPEHARRWVLLLTDRDFVYLDKTPDKSKTLRYSRGQPMGALSSWAGLAMVHHYLVFLASHRKGIDFFTDYLVLGDDIVIANKEVADSYVAVCNDYGIPIGLPKSFTSSEAFFQFASQNLLGEDNISPISLKEALAASGVSYYFGNTFNISKRLEFTLRMIRKGFIDSSNLLNIVRANSTYIQWRRYSRLFTRGIVPMEVTGFLISLLTKDITILGNKICVDKLIALLRGDYNLFTNTIKISKEESRTYCQAVYLQLKTDIQKSLEQIGKVVILKPLSTGFSALNDMYSTSAMGINERTLDSYMKLYVKYNSCIGQVEQTLTQEAWDVLYQGEDGMIEIDHLHLKELFIIREELSNVLTKQGLLSQVSQSLSTKVPYLIRFHLSLLNQIDYRQRQGRDLIGV
jgi:hypothetical protein